MTTVNIRRDVEDKFYRYKMPLLQTKIEGRGNGIKTVVPNMEDVARALNRPPAYPTKFFGTELGAQTTMANERYIVNGAHQPDRLRELLDTFIDKFVLCASCKNPETELVITGRGNNEHIHRDCKACGAHTDIDMRHKLTTFILKNPPKKKKGKKGMTAEANVGGPVVFDEKDNGSGEDSPSATPAPGDQGVPTSGTDIDAALGRGGDPILDNPDAIANKVANLNVDDDDEDEGSPYYQLRVWLEETEDPSDADVIGQIKELEIVGKHKALVEIGHKLLGEKVDADIQKRAQLLKVLVTSEKHQKSLLGGLERLLALSPDSDALIASGATSKALMALYQEDILEEEVIRQWGTHVSKKYVSKDQSKKVRKSADAFLKWLDEADDESDEE
ncbi:putative eukaryotic translation initiation factor 5 [Vanrija pseudolonga]|uniref:Eukaryotic translation initiation factor 5 n=1 Tax=Vanrija pseudolonga TaxID=143232 RepID=A0AAF0YEI2_9TREE|nr:putative eukaryotic translation initiation factor 5 [Vanrija pseudolonga]